jgi:4-amino-4-deoxy-L-arabinose transferase-like glycosyltransferase
MYYYPTKPESLITPAKSILLLLLCAVWLLTGLIGHDPWKPEETHSFGVVYHILQSGDWLVPTIAGEPYLEKPPLFYMTAAVFAKLFSPFLLLHDGARLASGLYMGLALLFIGLSGRELYGKASGWGAAVILMGCLGILVRAHLLITDIALLTSCAMMLYGFSLSPRRRYLAGLWLGVGVGIGFLSKGFIALGFFSFISLGLLVFQNWRTRDYAITLAVALLCALPWLTIWPTLLYLRSPELFAEWFFTGNVERILLQVRRGNYLQIGEYFQLLSWMAWPATPLALWTLWDARKKLLSEAEYQLPLMTWLVMMLTLSLVPTVQDQFVLPMLLPLTLLAAASLRTLRRGAANALDWFGIMTFALIAIVLWAGWVGLLLDSGAKITTLLKAFQPNYTPEFQPVAFWAAVIFSVMWMALVWRVGRSIRRSVINWAAGVTLIWLLAMTLWLPWLENNKSYRSTVNAIKLALPAKFNCVAGTNLGLGQRAMLHYFGDIIVGSQPNPVCDLMLVQGTPEVELFQAGERWKKIWEGGRPGDKNERYRLYRRLTK